MNISKLSVNNPVLINMVMVIIYILGIYYTFTIPKEAMPQISMGKFVITVSYPGVSPAEIETLIMDKIEDELADLSDIDYITSTAYEGRCQIILSLKSDVNLDKAWSDVTSELDKVKDLPEDASDPFMQNISTKDFKSACTIAIEGDSYTPDALKRIADKIKDDIGRVEYVSKVELKGYQTREFQVLADKTRLDFYGITFSAIENAVKARNMNLPGGSIKTGKEELLVRTIGEFDEIDQLKYIVVKSATDGSVIRLKDVAMVVDTYEETNVLTRLDGKSSVNLYVYQNTDGNILEVMDNIYTYVKTIPAKFNNVDAKVINDDSVQVESNITTLASSALFGIFLVFFTLYFFIGWRNAVFAAMGIPFSFMMTFWLMQFLGITINNLSLFALVLVLGMVVDDAIVVIENVHRNIEEGMDPKTAAIKGTQEVAWPVIAAVLTTIAAFLPLLMMDGNMGKFMAVFPKVVALALAASLFEALFILPSHLADFSKPSTHKSHKENKIYKRMLDRYTGFLTSFLKHRGIVISTLIILFIASFAAVITGMVRFEFFPRSTPSTLTIKAESFTGTSLEKTDSLTVLLENHIMSLPYTKNFKALNTNIGQTQSHGMWSESSNALEIRLDLVDADSLTVDVDLVKKDIRDYLSKMNDIVTYNIATGESGPPTGNDVELRIFGDDLDKLGELANKVEEILGAIPGVTDIDDNFDPGKKELKIIPDYDKLSIYNITVSELATFIRVASVGKEISDFPENGYRYNIRLKLQENQVENLNDMENLIFTTTSGKKIPLKDLCEFNISSSLTMIGHRDGTRMIQITANTGKYTENGVMKTRSPGEVNTLLFGDKIRNTTGYLTSFNTDHPGYRLEVGGQSEERNKSFNSLYMAFGIAVILIYMILGTQFRSYIQPLVVMLTIPFAFIGVILGLIITNTPFSLLSMIAVVALAGIVVNDSIVLVDFINKEREKGMDRWNSLISAGRIRLRPILLTTITTIFGLVPMIISSSESVTMWKPMAVSISFGLGFATILTLLVLPVVYSLIDGMTLKFSKIEGITLEDAIEIRTEKNYDSEG
ncbi:MAG: efflux RND transporter permease subunit [Candidatus Delongbacteria bacterium]|nr:efflux RND transporter permease subunit [Candidatus Delongbacteria bacterium]MBN2836481.1 efflux RND transporter permease subunit [Candidatus Delongbacteria bacterium]